MKPIEHSFWWLKPGNMFRIDGLWYLSSQITTQAKTNYVLIHLNEQLATYFVNQRKHYGRLREQD